MEELKFKIRGTETANVEIVPTEDGVEIIVKYGSVKKNYGSYEKQPPTPSLKDNLERLKDFCGRLKEDEDVNKKELLKFYKFYENKMPEWKPGVKIEKLWEKWVETAK